MVPLSWRSKLQILQMGHSIFFTKKSVTFSIVIWTRKFLYWVKLQSFLSWQVCMVRARPFGKLSCASWCVANLGPKSRKFPVFGSFRLWYARIARKQFRVHCIQNVWSSQGASSIVGEKISNFSNWLKGATHDQFVSLDPSVSRPRTWTDCGCFIPNRYKSQEDMSAI